MSAVSLKLSFSIYYWLTDGKSYMLLICDRLEKKVVLTSVHRLIGSKLNDTVNLVYPWEGAKKVKCYED